MGSVWAWSSSSGRSAPGTTASTSIPPSATRNRPRPTSRTPACRSRTQTGCVIAFSTFNQVPPADSIFGRTATPGLEVLCTNPAALGGGSAKLTPIQPSEPFAPGTTIGAVVAVLGCRSPPCRPPGVRSRAATEAAAPPPGARTS
ncbi:MAG: DUF3089 domain-containing protein [Thermoleophilaceae bacterium]|nr:DUF3089 domain-containing protein [Thermoleophilaceae bacterium]